MCTSASVQTSRQTALLTYLVVVTVVVGEGERQSKRAKGLLMNVCISVLSKECVGE